MKRFGLGFAGEYSRGLYEHLKQKGFEDSSIEQSGLVSFYGGRGYDKFRNRVMCPIVDRDGNVIGFSGRVIDHNSTPKYMNSPETLAFDKRRNLYGLNLAQKTERASMILCEGNLDVIALHQAGFDNAVASLGTAFSAEHAAVLSQYTDRVDLVFDSDEAGIKATLRAIPILRSAGITPAIVHVEPHKDPDEFIKNEGAKEFQARLDFAEDSYRFEIRTLYGKYDFNDPDPKREAVKEFASQMLDAHEADRPAYYKAMGDLIDQYDGISQQGREVMSPKFPAEGSDPISLVVFRPEYILTASNPLTLDSRIETVCFLFVNYTLAVSSMQESAAVILETVSLFDETVLSSIWKQAHPQRSTILRNIATNKIICRFHLPRP